MTQWLPAWERAEGAARATALFRDTFGGEPEGVWSAPGRVNVIGEHTDYNDGTCLPLALPHRTYVALRRRADSLVRLTSAQEAGVIWETDLATLTPGSASGWGTYVAGVAWALREAGYEVGGFEAAVDSCVPYGAGLSSSAALESAVAVALDDLAGWGLGNDAGRAVLAAACVRAENHIAGANTGGMDQAASLRAGAGHALLLDTRDGSVRQIPFDLAAHGLALLVVDTHAPHQLVDGQYAARRATCEEAARTLGVASLREVTDLSAALAALDEDPVAARRVRHVVTEIARVAEAVDLLDAGRVRELGPVLVAGHASLRDDYEVTCRELDLAADAAVTAGALGARMVGGGFGGSVIALVPDDAAVAVAEAVAAAFTEAGLTAPAFLLAVAADPAGRDA